MTRLYVRLGLIGTYETAPGYLATPLTLDGQPLFALQPDDTLSPLTRYARFSGGLNDTDYSEYFAISVQEQMPPDLADATIADDPAQGRLWAVIDTDAPPPVMPDLPDAPPGRYMVYWDNNWTDAQGRTHFNEEIGGPKGLVEPIGPHITAHSQDVMRQSMLDLLGYIPELQHLIQSSMFNGAGRIDGRQYRADAIPQLGAFATTMVNTGLALADTLTLLDANGDRAALGRGVENAFWVAQHALWWNINYDFSLGMFDYPLRGQEARVYAATISSHKIFISQPTSPDVIEDRGQFVGMNAGLGWNDITDPGATVIGSIFDDKLRLFESGRFSLGPGRDQVIQIGGASGSEVYGGSGENNISLAGATRDGGTSRIYGGLDDDILTGSAFTDDIGGGPGKDVLTGLAGDDTLQGYGRADVLRGGKGHDMLNGGGGNDHLTGGAGRDQFVFDRNNTERVRIGRDVITDFTEGRDLIVLGPLVATTMDDLQIVRKDADTMMIITDAGKIVVHGTRPLALGADDFLFTA